MRELRTLNGRSAANLRRAAACLTILSGISCNISRGAGPATLTPELELALGKLKPAPGLSVELLASEPLLANPVSFSFDNAGKLYVVETGRRRTSVYDIRNHPEWLDADFSFRTVLDRSNFFRAVLIPGNTNLSPKIIRDENQDGVFDSRDLEVETEQIRLLTDSDGDGKPDKSQVFATNFKSIVSGVAAGVLPHLDQVYFACIPDVWRLKDTDGDGVADEREALLSGFGVHIAYGGHDLHGLTMGPDGKLYFSIADRGLHVEKNGTTIANPDSGAVLRCNLDGSGLELFATGFRNPQELAFDEHGNLWTGDNNGDGGDKARWIHVVEGGDYGWHIGWQHQPKMGSWNEEKLWEVAGINTSASVLPPIAHIGNGPAGLAFYPGTGMGPGYANHFFLCDFPSGVHTFSVRPEGAGFAVENLRRALWDLYPTDVTFGPQAGFYVLDWVEGWEKTGKGRVFHVSSADEAAKAAALETSRILAGDFSKMAPGDLTHLLGHPDQRVRLKTQFHLTRQGEMGASHLLAVALNSKIELARLHAVWGLGMLREVGAFAPQGLAPLLDPATSPEVRWQVVKFMGEAKHLPALPAVVAALRGADARGASFAAGALGKLGAREAGDELLGLLERNQGRDPWLAHACVAALARLNDMDLLGRGSIHPAVPARLGVLLALRKLHRPELARFLYDTDPLVVTEAARAIYDTPLEAGMPQLAAALNQPGLPPFAVQRAIHANYRLGRMENAMALAQFAQSDSQSEANRSAAIGLLGRWANPANRDAFLGLWRPLEPRDARPAALAFRGGMARLLGSPTPAIRAAAVQTAAALGLGEAGGPLLEMLRSTNELGSVRLAALRALTSLKDPNLKRAVALAAEDLDETLRKEAATYPMEQAPAATVERLAKLLETGSLGEKQNALGLLANQPPASVAPILMVWLDRLRAGKAPKEMELDILEAARRSSDPLVTGQLERHLAGRPKNTPLSPYLETLFGGDAAKGRAIFFERADLGCLRCHKVGDEGGLVGPDLTKIASKATREHLLESIVFPNNRFSEGYESLVIRMRDGRNVVGLLRDDDELNVHLATPDDGEITLPKSGIVSLDLGLSAMPADLATLISKRDLRDLIEYLSTLK